jgi:hypothetical protein
MFMLIFTPVYQYATFAFASPTLLRFITGFAPQHSDRVCFYVVTLSLNRILCSLFGSFERRMPDVSFANVISILCSIAVLAAGHAL